MAPTAIKQAALVGGELDEGLHARSDLPRVQTCLARIENAFVVVTGGVSKRGGLEFVRRIKDSSKRARLVAFRYSSGDAHQTLRDKHPRTGTDQKRLDTQIDKTQRP